MPQYRRIGHDFTTLFDAPPNPEFWEPVAEKSKAKPKPTAETTSEES